MFCTGTNFIARKSAILEVSGFDEHSVMEDIATSYELAKRGYKIVYADEVVARGEAPTSLREYCKQQERWATGAATLLIKR